MKLGNKLLKLTAYLLVGFLMPKLKEDTLTSSLSTSVSPDNIAARHSCHFADIRYLVSNSNEAEGYVKGKQDEILLQCELEVMAGILRHSIVKSLRLESPNG